MHPTDFSTPELPWAPDPAGEAKWELDPVREPAWEPVRDTRPAPDEDTAPTAGPAPFSAYPVPDSAPYAAPATDADHGQDQGQATDQARDPHAPYAPYDPYTRSEPAADQPAPGPTCEPPRASAPAPAPRTHPHPEGDHTP